MRRLEHPGRFGRQAGLPYHCVAMDEPSVTTFPNQVEYNRARALLDGLELPYEVLEPDPGYLAVAVPGIVLGEDAMRELARRGTGELVCSGWAPYRPTAAPVDGGKPGDFDDDIVGTTAAMVFAACITDQKGVRMLAHLSGDLTDVFPYLNSEMPAARFNPKGPSLTFMERHRLVTLYPRRVAIAKADDLRDAWRLLALVRRQANETWARRATIAPSYEARRPATLFEIVKCLPRTNCGECDEPTCTAYAAALLNGQTTLERCRPLWTGEYAHLREAVVDLCAGLEMPETQPTGP